MSTIPAILQAACSVEGVREATLKESFDANDCPLGHFTLNISVYGNNEHTKQQVIAAVEEVKSAIISFDVNWIIDVPDRDLVF